MVSSLTIVGFDGSDPKPNVIGVCYVYSTQLRYSNSKSECMLLSIQCAMKSEEGRKKGEKLRGDSILISPKSLFPKPLAI